MEIVMTVVSFLMLMFFIFNILNVIRHIHLLIKHIRKNNQSTENLEYSLSSKGRIWLAISIAYIITFLIL